MHDILSRLPVKTLCRFKCVSKSWKSLISDPDFVANYNKASTENKDLFSSRRRLFFTTKYGRQSRVYSLNLDKFLNKKVRNVEALVTLKAVPTELHIVRKHHLPKDGWQYSRPIVHGSSSLFLSQSGDSSYSLINPVTKESKKLPKVPFWRLPLEPVDFSIYGFGFDYSSKDYKVINGQQNSDGVVFSVYTMQTDSWRQIEYIFPYMVLDYDGILVNGSVHWLVRKVEDGSLAIISFNLAEEKVSEIEVPPTATTNSRLGAFRDGLCITSISVSAETFSEFWVMKKYGASDSWTEMQVSRPYKELSHSGFWTLWTETHDLMMFNFSSLVMYNFDDDTYWNLKIGKAGKAGDISSIGIYVETPANLNSSSIKNQGR